MTNTCNSSVELTDEEKLEKIWKELVKLCKEFPVEIIIIPERKKYDGYYRCLECGEYLVTYIGHKCK